jgi:MFS family permease
MFAIPLQVYDLTRSPLDVGIIGVVEMVPTLVIGLLGGSLADSMDRRQLVLLTSVSLTFVSGSLAAQAFIGLHLLLVIYALAGLQSALSAISGPARRTLIPSLLEPSQLSAGLALNRLSFQTMLIAGPALAGLIAGTPGLGLKVCYLVDALSFGGSIWGVSALPKSSPSSGPLGVSPRAVAEGVKFIRHNRLIAGAFLADLNATIFGLPIALFPAINAERFAGDPRTLGLFTAAIGVGGLISATLSNPLNHVIHQGRAMLVSVTVWGASFAAFALVPGLWLTLITLAIAGAADTVTVVLRGTMVQASTPDEYRGRVTAAEYVVGVSGGQIGNLEAGALGSLSSPVVSALSGGLVTVLGAIAIGLALPSFRRYRGKSTGLPQQT